MSALCLKNKNNDIIPLKIYRSWILQTIWFLGFLLYHYSLSNKPASLSVLKPLGKTPTYYHMMSYILLLCIASLYDIALHYLLYALKLDFLTISELWFFSPGVPNTWCYTEQRTGVGLKGNIYIQKAKNRSYSLQFLSSWYCEASLNISEFGKGKLSVQEEIKVNDLEFFLMWE